MYRKSKMRECEGMERERKGSSCLQKEDQKVKKVKVSDDGGGGGDVVCVNKIYRTEEEEERI